MSWITVIWSMTASACLVLVGTHLIVWWKRRSEMASLAFAITALGVAGIVVAEFLLMRASTPEAFATALRWGYVPVFVIVTGIVWFVHLRFHTGRVWLARLTVGLRLLTLILDFTTGQTLLHKQITSLGRIEFLGEPVFVVAGAEKSPWLFLPAVANLVWLVYVADATVRLWRFGGRENRERALRIGGSLLGFIFVATGFAALINYQVIHAPYVVSFPFLAMVLAMAYEQSLDVLRSHQLVQQLQRSESQLRDSEWRLNLAAAAADLGLWSWSAQNHTIWATDRVKEILGFAPQSELTLEMFLSQLHPDDRSSIEAGIVSALGGTGGYGEEFRILHPDGQVVWIVVRGEMAFGTDGQVMSMTGVIMDTTKRKQSEVEIAQQRGQLAHLSRVGTVSELSGSLAHELNQPLAIILANAQAAQRLLAQQPPDLAEARDILADIVSEDQRAGEVIRRLRSLLKHGETSMQRLSVNEIIHEVLGLVRNDLIAQGVTVFPGLAASLPQITGDAIHLEQVLLNLILNACEAMASNPPEGRRLTIATVHHNQAVRVSVSDTGCGLPPDPKRVFEPFFTTKKQGLGLGLAICRSIVEVHKGRLWAEANSPADGTHPGVGRAAGATFHLELPAAEEER